MSVHLNRQQTSDWTTAREAVDEIAANTDSESSSKLHMQTLSRFVRDEPQIVVHLLALG
jgi:hypothetical protein